MKIFSVIAICLLLAGSATAQERAASQNYDAQVNWSALSTKIGQVDTQNKTLATTITAMANCNKVGKFWNGSGCIDPAAVSSITNCGNSGKLWNGSSCVDPYQLGNVTNCGNSGKTWNGSSCVDPYQIGNVTSCAWQGQIWNGSYCQDPKGVKSCQMCVMSIPTGDSAQCGNTTRCTGYSSNNQLMQTAYILDDTDQRMGGCMMFYSIQCQ
jgi:hypothetical protein